MTVSALSTLLKWSDWPPDRITSMALPVPEPLSCPATTVPRPARLSCWATVTRVWLALLVPAAGYDVTAKDFRTWAGTVQAARYLGEAGAYETLKQAERTLREAIGRVAAALGNTPAVCRKSYIHPAIVTAYLERKIAVVAVDDKESSALRPDKSATLAWLRVLSS